MLARTLPGFAAVALLALSGCGPSDNENLLEQSKGQNCGATTYTAFDPANHANQDLRLGAQSEIGAKAAEAAADPAKAAAVFDEVLGIYEGTADLRAKVQGRADPHFPSDPEAEKVGEAIDAAIVGAIDDGKAATTALDVAIASQIIDKNLTRFFYLSVYYELVLASRKTYDEAYGYLGPGSANDPATARGLASIAHKRDGNNQTDYASRLFQSLVDGSCALDTRLLKDGADSLADWKADEAYAAEVEEIDRLMLEVLALSVGHEMIEVMEAASPDEAIIKFYEGAVYFDAIAAAMRAKGAGPSADADKIATMFTDAKTAIEAGDANWLMSFDAAFVRDQVAAAFGVTVKG